MKTFSTVEELTSVSVSDCSSSSTTDGKRGGRISDGRADRTLFTVPLLQISPIWCQSRVASRWGCRQFEAGKRIFMKNFLSVLLSTKFSSLLYFYEFSQSGSVALGIVYN